MASRFDHQLLSQVRDAAHAKEWVKVDNLLSDYDLEMIVKEPELALTLSTAWALMSRHDERAVLLDLAKAYVFATNDVTLHLRWNQQQATRLVISGKLAEASELLSITTQVAERLSYDKVISYCYNTRGILDSYLGQGDQAVAHFTRALAAYRAVGDARGVAVSHYNIGVTLRLFERPLEALRYIHLAQDGWNSCGLQEEQILAQTERVLLATQADDIELALELSAVTLAAAQRICRPIVLAVALRASGAAKAAVGDPGGALSQVEGGIAALEGSIHMFVLAALWQDAATYCAKLQLLEQSARCWEKAEDIYHRMGAVWWRNQVRDWASETRTSWTG